MHQAAPPPSYRDALLASPGVAAAFKAVDRILASHHVWNHERDDLEGIAAHAAAHVVARYRPDDLNAYCYVKAWNDCWEYLTEIREWSWSDIDEERFDDRYCEAGSEWEHSLAMEELLACCRDPVDCEIVRLRTMAARDDIGDPLTLERIGACVGLSKSTVSRRIGAIEARFQKRND